jgi:hypothetical protein
LRDVLANARETNQEICVVVELGKATKKVKDKEKTGLSKRPATSGSRPSDENDEPQPEKSKEIKVKVEVE